MEFSRLAEQYRAALLEDVLPFWMRHSLDRECGGYFTCLDRRGEVFDTDKFVWLQGRQVWTLSKMYRTVEASQAWLDAARLGAEFIRDHAVDAGGRVYFALERDGRPFARTCIFSDCFCAMGLAEYAAACGADWARQLALQMYRGVQDWLVAKDDPYPKLISGARPMVTMAYDMINVNMSLELEAAVGQSDEIRAAGLASLRRILRLFIDRSEGLVFERVSPDGSHPDTFAGRTIIPGHAMESLWFIIEAARRWEQTGVIDVAAEAMTDMLEFCWDKQYGGLFHFVDARGRPPEQLAWDRKLWWVQSEALVAVLLAYRATRRAEFLRWFEKIHDYTWPRFSDGEFGEWFGYLDRAGEPFLSLKGGKWKGCFHVPRSLWLCWRMLDASARED